MKKYYEAYEERYKTIHEKGFSWSSDVATPIVLKTIQKYGIKKDDDILEIGCGEGRDAKELLSKGYNLFATDISKEAINYCQTNDSKHKDCYQVLNCLDDETNKQFDFIYAVAVIHMLVLDEDRNRFFSFIRKHLKETGIALVCTMGDGIKEIKTDIKTAFDLQTRNHPSGPVEVAATSCRMVSFKTFEKEILNAHLSIIEEGITESFPEFDKLMYAIIKLR